MANNMTDTLEGLLLDWANPAISAPTRPTTPLKARLMTANGSDSAAGTELTGGSYAAQTIAFPAQTAGSTANSANVDFTGMPAATVVGLEIWDSAGTPVRLWWGPLTASKTTASGDTLRLSAGAVTLALD